MKIFKFITADAFMYIAMSLILVGVAQAAAITSYDVHSNPQMFLNKSITPTLTVGIEIAAPKRNGLTIAYPTVSGGVLRLRTGSRVEDIHYSTGSVNATTSVVTLFGVTRNVCFNVARIIQSCGDGNQYSRGTIVELSDHHFLFNMKANIDRENIFTGSGGVRFSGSGSLEVPVFTTEAERDIQLTGSDGKQACVTGTGLCYYFISGEWRANSGSNVINASETVAGKIELATLAEQGVATATGSTEAFLVLQSKNTITSRLVYTGAQLVCGSGATTLVATWAGTTDGSYTFTLDGDSTDITAVDFTGAANMTGVALTLQTRIRAITSQTELVTWNDHSIDSSSNTGFTLTSSDTTFESGISLLSAQGAGTDISGAGGTAYMDCDSGSPNTTTITNASLSEVGDAFKTIVLDSTGFIKSDFLAPNTDSGGILIIQSGSALKVLAATTTGNVLTANGVEWVSQTPDQKTEAVVTAASAAIGASSTAQQEFIPTWTGTGIDANSLEVGSVVSMDFSGDVSTTAGTSTYALFLGDTQCAIWDQNFDATTGGGAGWAITVKAFVRTIGATGTVYCGGLLTGGTSATNIGTGPSNHNEITVDTTAQLQVRLKHTFGTSNAGNTTNMEGGSILLHGAP